MVREAQVGPLPGVTVTAPDGRTVVTDVTGRYNFPTPGCDVSMTMRLEKPGYHVDTPSIACAPNQSTDTALQPLLLVSGNDRLDSLVFPDEEPWFIGSTQWCVCKVVTIHVDRVSTVTVTVPTTAERPLGLWSPAILEDGGTCSRDQGSLGCDFGPIWLVSQFPDRTRSKLQATLLVTPQRDVDVYIGVPESAAVSTSIPFTVTTASTSN
jgi:hypothetical protein